MNAVHIFPYSPFISGGHTNAIRAFINAQRLQGIEAVGMATITPKGCSYEKQPLGFPLEEVDAELDLTWRLIEERFGFTPQKTVVHIHTVTTKLKPFLRDLQRRGIPYVLTSHGQLHFRSAVHWAKKFLYLNFFNLDIRKAAAIHFLTADAKQRGRWLLPGYAGECFVQPHALDVPELSTLPPVFKSDYGIPDDAFLWLFLGRLDVHVKGLDLLVEAFSRLDSSRLWLAFAGPDWEGGKEQLNELAERLQCRERLCFLGPVYGEKKWGVLKMADGFVTPSRWDAFPVAILEAMACALPVLTSSKMGPAKDFKEAGAARICPLDARRIASEMDHLAKNEAARHSLAEQGRYWVETYCNPQQVGLRFQQIYSSLLGG
ncbi:MAG: glycosyltransferase [Verrucomicrobiota bacterium]